MPPTRSKTVVGVGHASKDQVAHMVRMQLPGALFHSPDAADALAIAICHAHHAVSLRRVAQSAKAALA